MCQARAISRRALNILSSIDLPIVSFYKQMIERARVRSIKVIGATLTPFENALAGRPNQGYFTLDKEVRRLAVNHWIRTSGAFDAIIDFARVIADPNNSAGITAP